MQSGGYFSEKRQTQQLGILREHLDDILLRKLYKAKGIEQKLQDLAKTAIQNPFREAEKLGSD